MCGFVGCVGPASGSLAGALPGAATTLAHRGPHQQGADRGEGWAFGFRRLSILDLSPTGDQPMSTPDGRFRLVFNGEVYNYVELREQLRARGVSFRSNGDTEVVLHALALDGAGALDRFNGMYALAFVDTWERRFLLARDRLGVKPLFYRPDRGTLSFASELKALLALPDAPRSLDPRALVEYLALGYLSAESCIFEGYRKLPAGHLLSGDLDHPATAREHRHWDLEVEGDGRPWDPDELADLLEDAVRIRLRSDVPVGVFLSSGIDSGLVSTMAARAADPASRPLALTVGYPGNVRDESELAAATARRAGLDHRVVVQRSTALHDIDRLVWHYDEPFGDQSALATSALCEAAAEHGHVFLSGDGGDEAFGGYRRYVEARRRHRGAAGMAWLRGPAAAVMPLLPVTSAARFRLRKLSLPDDGFAAFFDIVADDPVVRSILPPALRPLADAAGRPVWERWTRTRGRDLTDRQRALDYDLYLPDDVLVKVDRASMAHSVEVRSPFLDYRLVERSARVPASSLLSDDGGKQPLRGLASRLLPPEVVNAPKRGFSVPVDTWFAADEGQAFLRERLLGPEARRRAWWDVAGVERLLSVHRAQRGRQFGELFWRLAMLEAWARQFADVPPATAPIGAGAGN